MCRTATTRIETDSHACSRARRRCSPTRSTPPLAPGLYVVATPIGNLADVSLRALAVLARADVIAAEDTRHSRKLLTHFGISSALTPYHEHNAAKERPKLLARIRAGAAVA